VNTDLGIEIYEQGNTNGHATTKKYRINNLRHWYIPKQPIVGQIKEQSECEWYHSIFPCVQLN